MTVIGPHTAAPARRGRPLLWLAAYLLFTAVCIATGVQL